MHDWCQAGAFMDTATRRSSFDEFDQGNEFEYEYKLVLTHCGNRCAALVSRDRTFLDVGESVTYFAFDAPHFAAAEWSSTWILILDVGGMIGQHRLMMNENKHQGCGAFVKKWHIEQMLCNSTVTATATVVVVAAPTGDPFVPARPWPADHVVRQVLPIGRGPNRLVAISPSSRDRGKWPRQPANFCCCLRRRHHCSWAERTTATGRPCWTWP
jgi:hypothetical protein